MTPKPQKNAARTSHKKKNTSAPVTIEVHVVKAELEGSSEQLNAQCEAGLDPIETLGSMFTSILSQIKKLEPLNGKQITELTKACNKGPWSSDQKKSLAEAFKERGSCTGDELGAGVITRRKTQNCPYFENFVEQGDFIDIRSKLKFSRNARAHKIAFAAAKIGLTHPNEGTKFRMVSLLAWGG